MASLSFLCLVLLLQDAPPPVPPAPKPDPEIAIEQRLAGLVDEAAMQKEVRELCKLGPRMGGTASGAKSAEYLRERFTALGLDVRVVEDPPHWCHAESSWSVVAWQGDEQHALASAWPYGFSPTSKGRAKLSKTSEAGVALLALKTPRKLEKKTAPAVVLVSGNTTLDGAYPRISHLSEGADNPAAVFGLARADAEWLDQALASGETVEIEYALEAKIEKASPRTVVARLGARGSTAAPWTDQHILFCAHGDSDAGGPGADDNASGIATLIGIAKAWKQGIDLKIVPAPAREVRFAVWGSEIFSTKNLLERGDGDGLIVAVLNYDQAGFGSGADQLNIEPDDLPANLPMVKTLLEVLALHGGKPGFPKQWATNKSLGGTDSYVFSASKLFKSNARPSLTLFTSAWDSPDEHLRTPGMPGESWRERDKVRVDYDNYYHSAGDTPENTTDKEPWNMGWCARVGLLAARRTLEASARAK
ncbi:MAG TPA: M28 family peptidase [Planctomycetota bacterium]|nr:M28 family peptidase [Planctomycetota bacterium]